MNNGLAVLSALAMAMTSENGFSPRSAELPNPPKFTAEQIKRCMEIRKPKFKRKIGR